MEWVHARFRNWALRLWAAAGAAALLVACCAVTFVLPTTRTAEVARAILVALGAVLGALMPWTFLGGSSNATSERRALEQRAAELAARTLAPASPSRLPRRARRGERRGRLRKGDLCLAGKRGSGHVLCRRAARAALRY